MTTEAVRAFRPWEALAVGLAALLCVALAGSLALLVSYHDAERQLDVEAEQIARTLSDIFAAGEGALTSLGALYQASDQLPGTQLAAIAEEILDRYPDIHSILHLSALTAKARAEFEQRMRRDAFPQFEIHQRGSADAQITAAAAPPYALAIGRVEPLEPTSARWLGLDVMSIAPLRDAVEDTVENARVAYVSAQELREDLSGILMLKTTYFGYYAPELGSDRARQLSGAFALVLDLRSTLAEVERAFPDVAIALRLRAASTSGRRRLVAGATFEPAHDLVGRTFPMRAQRTLRLPGTAIDIDFQVRDPGARIDWSESPLTTMAMTAVLVLSLISAMQYRRAGRQRERLARETVLQERERSHATLESIADAVIRCDGSMRIRYLNPVAERLTGWSQSDASGKELHEVVKLLDEHTRAPILTGSDDFAALARGHQDLLLENRDGSSIAVDHTAAPLQARDGGLPSVVLVIRDVSRERELASELAYQASHDPLTGLANRRAFEMRLREVLGLAARNKTPHALCYIDLDEFKVVNDTSGHSAGDQLLNQVSRRLQALLREDDLLARLGGDEFGILLADCPLEQARTIASRLRETIANFRFHWQDRTFAVSASIGVVPIEGSESSVGDIQSMADLACYAAKDAGRNRVHVYEHGDAAVSRHHIEMQWHSRLKDAIAEERFELHWQVIRALDPARHPAWMCEFLVRMVDSDGTLISPGEFIPAAERYALMAEVDRWVVEHAFAAIARFGTDAPPLCTINLSGHSIGDADLADFVIERLERHGIDASKICFEITETVAVTSFTLATSTIGRLRELGCTFALDDFGAGLSSFSYLKNLPIDYLKIDGQFVQDIVESRVDRAMVQSILGLARALGVATVAEMVPNEAVQECLRTLGVDYVQGTHVGAAQPLPANPETGEIARLAEDR